MTKNNIFTAFLFRGILGPLLLSGCFGLCLLKVARPHFSNVWSIGIGIAFALALSILLFSLFDLYLDFSAFQKQKEQDAQQLTNLKAEMRKLQTTMHALNQKELQELAERYQAQMQDFTSRKEEEMQHLQKAYEKAFEEANENKHRAASLQISLEEALLELGQKRQLEFLEKELKQMLEEIQQNADPKPLENREASKPESTKMRPDHHLEQLRKQFEEKSHLLSETRKELFLVENQCLSLQREKEFNTLEMNERECTYLENLKQIDDENRELENQVILLEEIVNQLLVPKKRAPRVKKNVEKMLDPSAKESLELPF